MTEIVMTFRSPSNNPSSLENLQYMPNLGIRAGSSTSDRGKPNPARNQNINATLNPKLNLASKKNYMNYTELHLHLDGGAPRLTLDPPIG